MIAYGGKIEEQKNKQEKRYSNKSYNQKHMSKEQKAIILKLTIK